MVVGDAFRATVGPSVEVRPRSTGVAVAKAVALASGVCLLVFGFLAVLASAVDPPPGVVRTDAQLAREDAVASCILLYDDFAALGDRQATDQELAQIFNRAHPDMAEAARLHVVWAPAERALVWPTTTLPAAPPPTDLAYAAAYDAAMAELNGTCDPL